VWWVGMRRERVRRRVRRRERVRRRVREPEQERERERERERVRRRVRVPPRVRVRERGPRERGPRERGPRERGVLAGERVVAAPVARVPGSRSIELPIRRARSEVGSRRLPPSRGAKDYSCVTITRLHRDQWENKMTFMSIRKRRATIGCRPARGPGMR
jgi:hypothetical protein